MIHGYLNKIELKTDKVEKNWTPILPVLRRDLNNHRYYRNLQKMREQQPFYNENLANNEKPQYEVGNYVYRKYDRPYDALGKPLPGRFRRGDMRYCNEVKQITKIIYMNDKPYNRYVLNNLPNVSFTAKQLIPAKRQERTYLVKQIIDRKVQGNITYYKVWWKGYLKRQSTWEPATQLIDDGFLNHIKLFNENLKKNKK